MNEQISLLLIGVDGDVGSNLFNELRLRGHKVITYHLYNTECDDSIYCDVFNM